MLFIFFLLLFLFYLVCRTCQADETCVLCHSCFSQSNHDGHDVAFYHAQAGGCCDCGDPDGKCSVEKVKKKYVHVHSVLIVSFEKSTKCRSLVLFDFAKNWLFPFSKI
jgi:Putative zinc finger in N-recognin (UBR box)